MANQILGVGGKQLGSAEIPAIDLAARAVVLGNLRHLRLPVDAIPLGEINALGGLAAHGDFAVAEVAGPMTPPMDHVPGYP